MHEIKNYSDKGFEFFPTELNIGMQVVQELFSCELKPLEVAALTGLLTVVIRLIQQVSLVRMYSTGRKKL